MQQCKDTQSWLAFASMREKTGASSRPFRYFGNAWDSSTKLHDFHARMYDQTTRRFMSRGSPADAGLFEVEVAYYTTHDFRADLTAVAQ